MFEWMFEAGDKAIKQQLNSLFDALKYKKLREFERLWYLITRKGCVNPHDWCDSKGRRLLHIAVMTKDLDILHLLEEAKVDAKDNKGYTAMHYAATIRESRDIVWWLVKNGIDLTIQSDQGYTPYDIVEGLWQAECNRLFQQSNTNRNFFIKGFVEKIDVLFDPSTSTNKIHDFWRAHPSIKRFLQQNQMLKELVSKKILMEQIQCPKQKTIDFSVFSEPELLSFGRPVWEDAYWYDIPTVSPALTTDKLHDMQLVESRPLPKQDSLWEESTLGLSKLYEKLETIPENKVGLAQTNATVVNDLSELLAELDALEINSSTQTLPSSISASVSETEAPIMRDSFFEKKKGVEEEFSEYCFVSTPNHTG